jgi:hypothetical protein
MMGRRRVLAVALAFAVAGASALSAQQAKPDTKKRSKQEQAEIENLVKLIDGVMAGQPAPTDIQMTLTPFFLKSQEQRTFVPFTLSVTGAPAAEAALYVRVVNPSAQPDPKTKKVEYPWDDIHFVPAAAVSGQNVRLNRVFMAPPGTYDVYVAMKERLPEKAPKNQVPKQGVLKTQVTVPDFWIEVVAVSDVAHVGRQAKDAGLSRHHGRLRGERSRHGGHERGADKELVHTTSLLVVDRSASTESWPSGTPSKRTLHAPKPSKMRKRAGKTPRPF